MCTQTVMRVIARGTCMDSVRESALTVMRVIARGTCMDSVRESALEVDSGRKFPLCTGVLNLCHCQCYAWLLIIMYIYHALINALSVLDLQRFSVRCFTN